MGQYWKIISLTSMETAYQLGKLGEGLWGAHEDLVQLLCKPLLPPSPEIELRARRPRTSDEDNAIRCVIRLLSTRYCLFFIILQNSTRSDRSDSSLDRLGRFGLFPAEIVIQVFGHLTTLQDAVCFGLTNTNFWIGGETRIHELYFSFHAPWMGHSLICLGDNSEDLPAECVYDHQLNEYAETLAIPQHFDQYTSDRGSLPADVEVARTRFVAESPEKPITYLVHRIWHYSTRRERKYPQINCFNHSISREEDIYLNKWYQSDRMPLRWNKLAPRGPLILRNFTKQVYVRSDTLAINDLGWGLGRAIMCRICWSSDSSTSMSYDGDISHGVWAGDKFDVVSLESLGGNVDAFSNDGWSDVSLGVREEIFNIWRSEFPDEWE